MDARKYMIVDLEKRGDIRMFVTEHITSIYNKDGYWIVKFGTSPRFFKYNPMRLLYLTDPERIDIEEKGLYINNKHINNVVELLRFSDGRYIFYHITYANGYYENIESNKVYITRTPIDKNIGSIWDYLRKLTADTGLTTDDGDSLLSKQYELVDLKRDNVPLAQYLGDKTKLATYSMPNQVYYPFGCNTSQKSAVEAALTHQVSIIQGPPGTGKTQTILNIIANLLMKGKTVLVVSNNNSAVENIADKLNGVGLGFIVAQLGSVQNKETFIANQPDYPDMTGWKISDLTDVKSSAHKALRTVSQGFERQLRQSQLKAECNALTKELKYNEMRKCCDIEVEWLNGKTSNKLLKQLSLYRMIVDNGHKPGIMFKLRSAFSLGIKMLALLNTDTADVIECLESAFYYSRKAEIERELEYSASWLKSIDIQDNLQKLRSASIRLLKHEIAKQYASREREKFTVRDIKSKSEEFMKEYPVVLSTTYSAKSCISKDLVFDYVIMDEASQVDIKTGVLSLSCATNVVIVGDDKQLPNVVSQEEVLAQRAIQEYYQINERYNAVTHSFLKSCIEVFQDAPVTLLREHYRCHPKIIEFCNQRFYDGELVAMTTDNEEKDVLSIIQTVPGNHAREHFNQREIDVITDEILPECTKSGSVGIITPYRKQAEAINQAARKDIASTVHKYQGRECDTIILSMVDNYPTSFSDDANLLNVAISRAKNRLYVVTTGNEIPQSSNLGQLIRYIQYNNFEVKVSKLHSVFDLLYQQYTAERLAFQSEHPAVSEHLSENLVYDILTKAISELGLTNTGVVSHYPLSRLVAEWNVLNHSERIFAESPFSHVDFLLFNTLTKRPLCTIEVDGWHFHKRNDAQQSRDAMKDRILNKLDLAMIRISTVETVNLETIKESILKIIKP